MMHLGYNNPSTHIINTQVPVLETTAEKDLGVIVDNILNFH